MIPLDASARSKEFRLRHKCGEFIWVERAWLVLSPTRSMEITTGLENRESLVASSPPALKHDAAAIESDVHVLQQNLVWSRVGNMMLSGAMRTYWAAENSSDMISLHALDANATYLYCSAASKTILGVACEYVTGRSAFEFVKRPQDEEEAREVHKTNVSDHARAMEKYKEYNGTNNFYTAPLIETTIQHKDGTTIEAESSATYLHDAILVITRNVTARKTLLQEAMSLSAVVDKDKLSSRLECAADASLFSSRLTARAEDAANSMRPEASSKPSERGKKTRRRRRGSRHSSAKSSSSEDHDSKERHRDLSPESRALDEAVAERRSFDKQEAQALQESARSGSIGAKLRMMEHAATCSVPAGPTGESTCVASAYCGYMKVRGRVSLCRRSLISALSHQVCLQHFQAEHVAKLTLRDAPHCPPVEGECVTDAPCQCSKVCIPMRSLVLHHAKTCTDTECVVPMCNFSIYNELPLPRPKRSYHEDSETVSLATTPVPSSSSGAASHAASSPAAADANEKA